MRVFVAEYLSDLVQESLDPGLRAQGAAMRDAVLADLGRQPGVQIVRAAPEPGEDAFALVRRQLPGCDAVWLIAPETDDLLGRFSDLVPPAQWLGCDSASIRLTASKARTTAWLHAANVLTPRTFDDDTAVRAWVVKPDDGVGASEARRHTRRADAEADLAQRPGAVLEPWVEGPAMSLSLVCDGEGGAQLLSVNRQLIDIADDGALIEHGVEALGLADATPALRRLAQQVARSLPGLFGLAGIDYVAHPARGPVLIEVNPRVTSAYAGLLKLASCSPARSVLDLWRRRSAASAASTASTAS